jgi:DNA-directed RNA polymerase specialized sigma24 family protein
MLISNTIEAMDNKYTSENVVDGIIRSEQMALLRHDLAFIKSDYRNIVVAYYIDKTDARDIASAHSLSIHAVQQRLHRARKILKEGMDMKRNLYIENRAKNR